MTTYGLTDAGFRVKRASEVLADLRAQIVTELDARGLPSDIDFDDDTVAGIVTSVLATAIGEIWESAGALYDATDPSSASRRSLDNIGAIRRVRRLAATKARLVLELGGTATTLVPAGVEVLVAAIGDPVRFRLLEAVTLTGGGDLATFEALEPGAILLPVTPSAAIVTVIAGWASATYDSTITLGTDTESDAAYRLRQTRALRPIGGRSVGAIRSALLAIEGVEAVALLENRSDVDATFGSKVVPPHAVLPVIFPGSLPTATQQAIATALFDWGPSGIRIGRATTADNEVTVAGEGFASVVIGWDDGAGVACDVTATLVLESGVVIGDVSAQVQAAIVALIEGLDVGQPLRLLQVLRAIGAVEGVAGATVLLDGSAADFVVTFFEKVTAGTFVVTT